MKKESDGKTIEIIEGDITEYDGEAIVNAANNHFWMGGGVAGAIKRAGGRIIEEQAMRQGPKTVGEAVITDGGTLRARKVIHAAVMGQDLSTDSSKILSATMASLRLAESDGVSSIAFPALGTGVGGFPLHEAADIMIRAVKSFLEDSRILKRVTFVLYGKEAYDIFSKTMADLNK